LAGATVNLVFGIIAFAAIFSYIGIPEPISEARIGYISPDSPAATAGLSTNTEIIGFKTSADGELITTSNTADVIAFVQENKGREVIVVTSGQCDGTQCDYSVTETPVYLRSAEETPENEGSMGVAFDSVIFIHYPWWQMPGKATLYGLQESLNLGREILKALSKLGTDLVQKRQVSSELAGPVGIVHQAHSAGILNQGFIMILSFAAMLSINLAIMNVLPIPPLDGGKAVFTILEAVFSRKHLYKIEYWFSYTGYFLLMALILFITARDVIKLFS
ncbi:MAG: Peptidase protein, partial [Patescibacteria group bacterium]|nr:Peptidase protein [Patescibacteria group bacterium]